MKKISNGLAKPSPETIARALDDTVANIIKIMVTFVGASCFCLLSLMSPDSTLLTNGQTLNVPFAGPVSFVGFLVVGPAVLITLRILLQIYIEHFRRLEPIGNWLRTVRVPTLAVSHNPLLRAGAAFVTYLLLPLTMVLFSWKAAVLQAWLPGVLFATMVVIVSHVFLSIQWRWRWKLLSSLAIAAPLTLATIAIPYEFFGVPLQRPFNLSHADLAGLWLGDRNLVRADFSGANLQGADLSHSDLTRAEFSGANLVGAKLTDAFLEHANFFRADLSNADLSGAIINNCYFDGTKLTGARLHGATLGDCLIQNSDFSHTDLGLVLFAHSILLGTKFLKADLSHAWMDQVTDLTQGQLDLACTDGTTELPPGLHMSPQMLKNCKVPAESP
jgi:hypothetical protein